MGDVIKKKEWLVDGIICHKKNCGAPIIQRTLCSDGKCRYVCKVCNHSRVVQEGEDG